MTTINQPHYSPVLTQTNHSPMVNNQEANANAASGIRKNIELPNIQNVFVEPHSDKPTLNGAMVDMTVENLSEALSQLMTPEKAALLSDIRHFLVITPEKMQATVAKVLAEENKTIKHVVDKNHQLDETDIKLISQAIQVVIASSFSRDALNNQAVSDKDIKTVKSINDARKSEFVGIISSDIMLELIKIIRKVVAELNISDRRISADFLVLNAKMVEAAAESTIKEGKEMFSGALAGFFTSLAISTAGAAFQGRALHKQNQSIKTNLVKANQNGAAADRLTELNANSLSSAKGSALTLKTKEGTDVKLADQATPAQQALSNQRGNEAAQRTNKLGLAERDEHERIMNKTRVKMGIAEQGGRLSENAGQMVTSGNQVNVKGEEANKMTQQSVADVARTVSTDKDKQVDKSQDLVKQMNEHLREIREGQLRTFQSVVRG